VWQGTAEQQEGKTEGLQLIQEGVPKEAFIFFLFLLLFLETPRNSS